ncbi:hypothetical protein AB0J28_48655, partial [Streptosporangium canum]|uniref:hypothetical protein n=1 Tax=Streptosporangium canum TaxID=324952 RepID=UPI00342123FC
MATVVSGGAGALPATASEGDEPGGRVLVILNPGAGSERLEEELTGRGRRVRVAGVPAGDLAACVG